MGLTRVSDVAITAEAQDAEREIKKLRR